MKIKRGFGWYLSNFFIYGSVILLCITTIYPFWQSLIISISPRSEAMGTGLHIWTKSIDLAAWRRIFVSEIVWTASKNTIIRTIGGTVLGILLSILAAYPLSKKRFPHKKLFSALIVFTMLFNGGIIPTYILVKNLNLMNTIWALIIPAAVSPFNVIIIKNFFEAIPAEFEESAKIDGANDMLILWSIIIPLSLPVLATVSLWVIVGNWNSWFDATMYITDRNKTVLQLYLREIVITKTALNDATFMANEANVVKPADDSVQAAATMFVTLPILIVYPFLQKYFAKGVMVGAVKG